MKSTSTRDGDASGSSVASRGVGTGSRENLDATEAGFVLVRDVRRVELLNHLGRRPRISLIRAPHLDVVDEQHLALKVPVIVVVAKHAVLHAAPVRTLDIEGAILVPQAPSTVWGAASRLVFPARCAVGVAHADERAATTATARCRDEDDASGQRAGDGHGIG